MYINEVDLSLVVDNINYMSGGINIGSVIDYMLQQMFFQISGVCFSVLRIVVVIIDGKLFSFFVIVIVVDQVCQNYIFLIVVGVGNGVDINEFYSIVDDLDSFNMFIVNSYDQFNIFIVQIIQKVCLGQI